MIMYFIVPVCEGRPIWAVPYREEAPLRPVEVTEEVRQGLYWIDADDPRACHVPKARPIVLGIDAGGRPLRCDAPQDEARMNDVDADYVHIPLLRDPGCFLLPDGRPAILYGAKFEPMEVDASTVAIVPDPTRASPP